jgi:hypothetical protein
VGRRPAFVAATATMVTPLVKRDVVKKRIKKFKRMQHDRKICVKVCFRCFFSPCPPPFSSLPFLPCLPFLSCASFHGKDVMISSLYHLSEDEDEDVPALLLLAEGPCSLSSYFLVIIAIRFHLSRNYEGVLSTFDDSLFSVSLHLWFSGFHIYVPSVFFPPFLYSDEI